MATVVTVSAAYGAGGSQLAPRVAARLGVPFHDRAIPVAVAERLGVDLTTALEHDEDAAGGGLLHRLLSAFAAVPAAALGGPDVYLTGPGLTDPAVFADRAATAIRELAEDGGVFLGRAAAVVLAEHPTALHVRLRGRVAARRRQAAARLGLDEATAARQQAQTDAAREGYLRQFYGRRPDDPDLYHLVLDATAVDLDTCVELVVAAARGGHRPVA